MKSPESRLSFTYNFPSGELQNSIRGGGSLRFSTYLTSKQWLKLGASLHLSKFGGIGESRYFFTLKGAGFSTMLYPIYRFFDGFALELGANWTYIYRALGEGSEGAGAITFLVDPILYLLKERFSLFLEFPFLWIPGKDKSIFLYGFGFGVSLKWGQEPGLR
jgi:hypothetical protein